MTTLRIFGKIACFSAMMLASVPLVAGFYGAWHPALDSFAHFRVHLAVLMMAAALPLLATSLRWQAVAALLFGAAALATTSSSLPGIGPVHAGFEPRTEDRPVYKMLQMNLRFNNTEPAKVLSLVGRTQPDVITFEEVSTMWADKLAPLFARYPYHMLCPHPDRLFGVAILSRRPFAEGGEPKCFDNGSLAIATVDFGGRTSDIAALHLGWPWPFAQSQQIDSLSEDLATLGDNAMLGGDFNATPWSAAVARVARAGGLKPMPAAGRTWLTLMLPDALRFAGLTIDHIMAKGDVTVHSVTMEQDAGSDHRPLLVEFSFRPTPPSTEDAETQTVSAQPSQMYRL